MQDAPGFLECFVYSVQFLLFVCLESHLFRVLCTGNGGVLHWNHFLSFALQKHPARCCAQKMVLQWSRRCCNTCKTAWNVKFLLANCVILIEKKIQEWDWLLLELQEKLSNGWAMFSMSTFGRRTMKVCSWRWDQIRVKAFASWISTYECRL